MNHQHIVHRVNQFVFKMVDRYIQLAAAAMVSVLAIAEMALA